MAHAQKTAIVTGGSQGIGAGLVKAFLDRGYNVVANSRNITTSGAFEVSDKPQEGTLLTELTNCLCSATQQKNDLSSMAPAVSVQGRYGAERYFLQSTVALGENRSIRHNRKE